MERLIFIAPEGSIPDVSSEAYLLLATFADGHEHPRDAIGHNLGGGFRAYLQQLMGEYYQYWLIHSETKEYNGRKQAHYQLDERHFSCDWEADKDARTVARKRYKERSFKQAASGLKRYQQATAEKYEADQEYQERFGDEDLADGNTEIDLAEKHGDTSANDD